MNCPFCQKETSHTSPRWMKCLHHDPVAVYIQIDNQSHIQMSLGKDYIWLHWDTDGRFNIEDVDMDEVIIELDYHPKIKPEEAQEFFDRIMKMKAFL